MKYLKLASLLLFIISFSQCTKDDQIKVKTDITTITDQDDVDFLIQIVDKSGNALVNAKVTDEHTKESTFTNDQGLVLLKDVSVPATGLPVSVESNGWMKMIKVLRGKSNSQTFVQFKMYPFDSESILETGSIGTISGEGTLRLPSSLVRSDNSLYSGPVTVKSHYYDPTDSDFLTDAPGDMSAIGLNEQLYTLKSFGMYAIELYDAAGNELNVPDGETATIQFPVPDNYESTPDEVPLWSMDEENGKWIEEGMATRDGNYLVAEVSHFSWWNCDIAFDPVTVCMTLVDQFGTPLSGYTYLISSPGQQIAYYSGTTDTEGNLCAQVPLGEPVVVSVLVNYELTNPTDLGTFDESTDLGNVVMDITLSNITGTALGCDGQPVDNAVVRYTTTESTGYTTTNSDGVFNFTLFEEGSVDVQLYDYADLAQSELVNVVINNSQQNYDLGSITLCDDIDGGTPIYVVTDITSDITWQSGHCYILGGRIMVQPGATLTIEPGVIVKGEAGSGANYSGLIVAKGAQIIAEGTAELPIVFTSVLDEIMPSDIAAGNFMSPNLEVDQNGLWGGLFILGNAPISAQESNPIIEGAAANSQNWEYGGDDPMDNSGVLRYVSIRHCGVNIGDGAEANGITLAGVGAGTTIEHIELVATRDDGIEWFGGTVNVDNVVTWNAGDDAIDTDQAWGGTLNNFIVITPTDAAFELDGPEGTHMAQHTIQNGTVVSVLGGRVSDDLIDTDTTTSVELRNIHFVAPFEAGQKVVDTEAINTTFDNITFEIEPANLINLFEETVPVGCSAGGTPQADASVFNWTWSAQAGTLDGL